jgi:type II secretory ATPase GspE/PulE/Tfp pilus assembly ATPase PilB-like protein
MKANDWLNGIFKEAFERGASDIFIDAVYDAQGEIMSLEPELRIDGWNIKEAPLTDIRASQVIVLIKNESEMGTSALNAPEEGRFPFKYEGGANNPEDAESLDVRVTIFPTVTGEFISMRIPPVGALPELSSLGISEYNMGRLKQLLSRPQGLIELAGPMGSGKTTTMYSVMKVIGGERSSVVTVEDPKERTLEGARQMVINPRGGMTYAAVLKSLLRVVMDAMLIGEIRDMDTASAAVKFATSGTKVLSSIHSGDPVSAIARTIDLSGAGVIAAMEALSGIMSQRLIRTFHDFCKGKGCVGCEGTGYKGRMPVHEVLINSSSITDLMLRGAPRNEVHKAARDEGMISFHEDADRLLEAGRTDVKQIEDSIGFDTRVRPKVVDLSPASADHRREEEEQARRVQQAAITGRGIAEEPEVQRRVPASAPAPASAPQPQGQQSAPTQPQRQGVQQPQQAPGQQRPQVAQRPVQQPTQNGQPQQRPVGQPQTTQQRAAQQGAGAPPQGHLRPGQPTQPGRPQQRPAQPQGQQSPVSSQKAPQSAPGQAKINPQQPVKPADPLNWLEETK